MRITEKLLRKCKTNSKYAMIIKDIKTVAHERMNEASNSALSKFRNAVLPIYGADEKGLLEHIGSALLLYLPEGHFLLTAAHIIDCNTKTTLYLGIQNVLPLQFEVLITEAPNGDRKQDNFDFAIARLNTELQERLSGSKFIKEEEISRSIAITDDRIYTLLGYPNSKNKINPQKTYIRRVIPWLGIYTSIGKQSDSLKESAIEQQHILLAHGQKNSLYESGETIRTPDLHGFSGGAIIDLGPFSLDTVNSTLDPKLAALIIDYPKNKQLIRGTRLSTILKAIREKHSGNSGE